VFAFQHGLEVRSKASSIQCQDSGDREGQNLFQHSFNRHGQGDPRRATLDQENADTNLVKVALYMISFYLSGSNKAQEKLTACSQNEYFK